MAIYEGKWRCPRCSSVNAGRNIGCLTCGVKRSEDVEFFLDEDAAALTDETLINQAKAGADWICLYCGSNCRAAEIRCAGCGSLRDEANKQLVEETSGVNDWTEAARKLRESQISPTILPKNSPSGGRLVKFGLLGAGAFAAGLIGLFITLVYISTLTYPVEVEVSGLEWQRTIALEEYKTVTETAWEGEVPQNARIQKSERALHHTDKLPDGTRSVPETYTEQVADGTEKYVCGKINKKNGYFEDKYCERTKYKSVTKTRNKTETLYRDVPVYKTRHTYQLEKWTAAGEKTTSGDDFNPQWANVGVDNVKTREAGRTESYNLLCKELGGKNKPHKFKLSTESWKRFQNGQHLKGKTDFFGKLVSIDGLNENDLKAEK